MRQKSSKVVGKIIIYAFLLIVFLFAIFPIIYILLSSFKTSQEIMVGGTKILPDIWHFENYIEAWNKANFGRLTLNSILYSSCVIVGCVFTACIGGYVFSRGKTRFTKVVHTLVLASMFVSVGTLALYPQLQIFSKIGLTGSLIGPVIIRVFGMNATQMFIATGNLNQIPKEIDDAARIDGCGFFKTFWYVIFPLLKPLIATIGLMSFRSSWSDYLLPYVFTISRRDRWPLVVGLVSLKSSGENASAWNLMLAGIGISIIPMAIIYLCLNKYFVSGMTEGALKG